MKKSLFAVIALFVFASCASKKAAVVSVKSGDGSSFQKAVIINETSERKGVDDEYAWIRKTYPGAKNNSQALVYHDKKPFDVLHITTANGKQLAVYFDISSFYGKWN
jgi:hypothetical protein